MTMTKKEFDSLMTIINEINSQNRSLQIISRKLEDLVISLAGVKFLDRGPGFAGWYIEDGGKCREYFNSPSEALEGEV